MKSKFIAILVLFSLSACDLASKRAAADAPSDNDIFAYFTSRQYATDNAEVASLSSVWAVPVVAPKTSTFATLMKHEGCVSQQDGINVPIQFIRTVDIGQFTIKSLELNESITMVPYQTNSPIHVISKSLSRGDYTIKAGDATGAIAFDQALNVAAPSARIIVVSGQTGTPVQLASPAVPTTGAPNDEITIDKTKDLYVVFDPPANTAYIAVTLQDWVPLADGSFQRDRLVSTTCYVDPADGGLGLSKDALTGYPTGSNGTLLVDFVRADLNKDLGRVKESLVESMVRQVHGLVLKSDTNGVLQPIRLGTLKFQ